MEVSYYAFFKRMDATNHTSYWSLLSQLLSHSALFSDLNW